MRGGVKSPPGLLAKREGGSCQCPVERSGGFAENKGVWQLVMMDVQEGGTGWK